jgi:hypothetical protein
MGDPNKLSADEQKVYDRLKQVCEAHNFKRLSETMKVSCVLQKRQLELDDQLKQQAIATQAAFQVLQRKLDAVTYVSQTVSARQIEATLLLGALIKASGEYDAILQSRASAPIAGELFFLLATSFVPDLEILGKITRRYASSRFAKPGWRAIKGAVQRSNAASWEELADDVLNAVNKSQGAINSRLKTLEKFADSLDEASKHLIDGVYHPIQANKELDEASQDRLKAFRAKNQIVTEIIGEINRTLTAVVMFEPILYRFIIWYDGDDLVAWLRQKFREVDLDSPVTNNPGGYDVIESLILYDMLHMYTKSYFKIEHPADARPNAMSGLPEPHDIPIDDMPDYLPEHEVEGLDLAQRKMIYDRFGKVPWEDRSRPAINSYKDLIKYWGGGLEFRAPPAGYLRPG